MIFRKYTSTYKLKLFHSFIDLTFFPNNYFNVRIVYTFCISSGFPILLFLNSLHYTIVILKRHRFESLIK